MSDLHITLSLSEDDRALISDSVDMLVDRLEAIAKALAPLNTTTPEFYFQDETGNWCTKPNLFYKPEVS